MTKSATNIASSSKYWGVGNCTGQVGRRTENSEGPRIFNQLLVYHRYVAWFLHANVRHGIINNGGSPESVKMKASSSLTFHCMSNGVVSDPSSTGCGVTNQTKRGPRHRDSLLDRTSKHS
jgi:hypothetical protein